MASELDFAQQSLQEWFGASKLERAEAAAGAKTFRMADLGLFRSMSGSLIRVERLGNVLRVHFASGVGLVVRLGTGKFLKRAPEVEVKWSRARFVLASGEVIHFQDQREEGHLEAVPLQKAHAAVLTMGVKGLTVARLQQALSGSSGPLARAMMDEERIVGLEQPVLEAALFKVAIHPERGAKTLGPAEWKDLVLALEGEPGPQLVEFGNPCTVCGTLISGRTWLCCETCQPKEVRPEGDQMRKKPRPRKYRG